MPSIGRRSFTSRSIKRHKKEVVRQEIRTSREDAAMMLCAACGVKLVVGDAYALVPLGPGVNTDSRARAREGRPYTAAATPIHWACATGEEMPLVNTTNGDAD